MSTVTFGTGASSKRKAHGHAVEVRFIQPPCFSDGVWRWGWLVVNEDPVTGLGLYAGRALPAGLLIPYIGQELRNHPRLKSDSYDFKSSGDLFVLRPQVTTGTTIPECQHAYCIASYANEASAGVQRYNCEFVNLPLGGCRTVMPSYPEFAEEHDVFLLVMCDVPAGQPLLAHYGRRFVRHYRAAAADEVEDRGQWNRTQKRFMAVVDAEEAIPVDESLDYEALCAAPPR